MDARRELNDCGDRIVVSDDISRRKQSPSCSCVLHGALLSRNHSSKPEDGEQGAGCPITPTLKPWGVDGEAATEGSWGVKRFVKKFSACWFVPETFRGASVRDCL
jgi:hypothetical protein